MTQLLAIRAGTLAELRTALDAIALDSLHDVADNRVLVENATGKSVRLVLSEEQLADDSLAYTITIA